MKFEAKYLALAFCGMILVGCGPSGPPIAPTTGTVKYKGQPVSGATVTFVLASDPAAVATGTTDAEGKFSLKTGDRDGAPIGKNNISIMKASNPLAGLSAEEAKKKSMEMMQPSKDMYAATKSVLPAKYSSPGGSGLTAEVQSSGPNDFPLDLKD